ncbi:ATP-binding cassette domain-containing protein, partial [Marichromatium gracile]|uniref:ATP-binding cassette domain-containing protein n=1 Tax=Marichromatium gracile TaxID=1048 RepID=UPI001905235D
MYKLTVEGLHKSYGDNEVLKGVSLKAKTGDVISLIGASGSGKSTFLRCINFLETPNDGAMTLDDKPIRMVSDRHGMRVADDDELQRLRTRLAMVFQHFNLFPHLTILQNCTLAPMWVRKMPKRKAEEIAMHYLERVRIPEQAHKFPGQLSGGQQ